jgi:hypothetical protein
MFIICVIPFIFIIDVVLSFDDTQGWNTERIAQ